MNDETRLGRMRKRLGKNIPSWNHYSLACQAAAKYGLDEALVCALCEVESGWNPWAVRYEARYKWLVGFQCEYLPLSKWVYDTGHNIWYPLPDILKQFNSIFIEDRAAIQTELLHQQTSVGLLQIMGAVARERGFRDWLTELCDPAVNLEWGCKHLRWMLDHAGSFNIRASTQWQNADLAAAWNGGARIMEFVNAKPTGRYKNQSYVDRVVRAMVNYE